LFASRLCGSADIYRQSGKGPGSSINFVTCHDGFTLNDLVSYQFKHNEANAEKDHDGADENLSGNNGIEGPTNDADMEAVRKRLIKNFLLTLLVSRGVPMLLGGDEFRRTQGGNNNAYCQDNETSWVDWNNLEQHHDIYRFAKGLIAFRLAHPILSDEQFYTNSEIQWFNPQGGLPKWTDPTEKHFAGLIHEDQQRALFLMFNAGMDAIDFHLPPPPPGSPWRLAVDTFVETPFDLLAPGEEPLLQYPQTYLLKPRSSAILLARKPDYADKGGSR